MAGVLMMHWGCSDPIRNPQASYLAIIAPFIKIWGPVITLLRVEWSGFLWKYQKDWMMERKTHQSSKWRNNKINDIPVPVLGFSEMERCLIYSCWDVMLANGAKLNMFDAIWRYRRERESFLHLTKRKKSGQSWQLLNPMGIWWGTRCRCSFLARCLFAQLPETAQDSTDKWLQVL